MAQEIVNRDNTTDLAESMFTALVEDLVIPDSPNFDSKKFDFDPNTGSELYKDVFGSTIEEVTAGVDTLEGKGAFDIFMKAVNTHLERQYDENRITGAEYAKMYTANINNVMTQAKDFILRKDQSRWTAYQAQMQARIAAVQAIIAQVNLEKAKIQALTDNFKLNQVAAQYAKTKMEIASEEARHDGVTIENAIKTYRLQSEIPAEVALKEFQLNETMPAKVAMDRFQTDVLLPIEAALAEFQRDKLQPIEADMKKAEKDRAVTLADIEDFRRKKNLPVELAQQQHILNERQPAETGLIKENYEAARAAVRDTLSDGVTEIGGTVALEKESVKLENETKDYNLKNTLPKQLEALEHQVHLVSEQFQAERAKTVDTRSDLTAVKGLIGTQKDLYKEQISAYIRDSQQKAAKLWTDILATRISVDDGTGLPDTFNTASINTVLSSLKTINKL